MVIYKPEVDGLRAIAVVLVLLCHMGLFFPGGYIGVDVFFVISGFLITSNIIRELDQGNFSFWRFYGRRFVRLYPALIVTAILTFVAGFLLFTPDMLANLARSGRYVLASASNLYFYKHQGYFDLSALRQPFLHTWTLGVEWQFYLLAPMLIWLLSKFSKRVLFIGLLLVVLVSLVFSQRELAINADKAYYLAPYRAFELGLGSLLVFLYPKKCAAFPSIVLTVCGVAMVFAAGLFYGAQTAFPGYAALLPTVGAALCIYGAQGFNKGNLLRLPPIVYIGKISYSVYLIHWPVLVCYTYYVLADLKDLTYTEKWGLTIISLVLGALLYTLVEKKINWKALSRYSIKAGVSAMLVCVGLIAAGLQYVAKEGEGLPWRVSNMTPNIEEFSIGGNMGYRAQDILGDSNGYPIAILAGDSFTQAYLLGIDEAMKNSGRFMQATSHYGCLLVAAPYNRKELGIEWSKECLRVYEDVMHSDLPIVLAQRWEERGSIEYYDDNTRIVLNTHDDYMTFAIKQLELFRAVIGDRPLIIVEAVPFLYFDNREAECVLNNRPSYLPQVCMQRIRESYRVEEAPVYEINQKVREFAETHPNTYFIEVSDITCPQGICTAQHNAMLYSDGSHLSRYGSRLLGAHVVAEVEKILDEE